MILLIDNYDSFSYNLYQLVGSINPDIKVIRNDEMSVEEIKKLNPSHIIISPGPGTPSEAGIIEDLVKEIDIPLLGVCLGHQAICEAYGAKIIRAPEIVHGKKDLINIDNSCHLFNGLNEKIIAARYHSLIASDLPDSLKVIATTKDGIVMGVKHESKKIYGIQFHPESILTPVGKIILKNFLKEGK